MWGKRGKEKRVHVHVCVHMCGCVSLHVCEKTGRGKWRGLKVRGQEARSRRRKVK